MSRFSRRFSKFPTFASVVFITGIAFGYSKIPPGWRLNINGQPSQVQVHILKNMHFVSLEDLAKLPGWNVTIDLGNRSIALRTPNVPLSTPKISTPGKQVQAAASQDQEAETGIEAGSESAGPPNNVRMTVKASLSSLDELRKALFDGVAPEMLKQKEDSTAGIVQQAENLLWSLPRTRTLQADIQVALEDLQSQVNLVLALDQAKEGLLPWTHPTAQDLLTKYPDLHPCRVTKGSTDGLDVSCARKMMTDLADEDFNDVERDLDQYR